jgi:hypothetical protein
MHESRYISVAVFSATHRDTRPFLNEQAHQPKKNRTTDVPNVAEFLTSFASNPKDPSRSRILVRIWGFAALLRLSLLSHPEDTRLTPYPSRSHISFPRFRLRSHTCAFLLVHLTKAV